MIQYIEYLGLPTCIAIGLVGLFLFMQVVGEFLEFKGKVVPEVLKVRKIFARRRKEKENMRKMAELYPFLQKVPATLDSVQKLLSNVDAHYSHDNITMRDTWMSNVNQRLDDAEKARDENRQCIQNLEAKLDKNNEDTLSLLIDSKRNTIINFADLVIDENKPVTREQFHRIFKLYKEYEDIIKKNNMTNGEVDIAIRIIKESYEKHMRHHSFVEDIRGYNI
ncbi:MAG: hypothetical protein UH685_08730 [Bacteroidaceae bacterium]|jgi:hypothetical protein|nr:hypothetical protein [Bacteroidaceae bacterium]